MHSHRGMTRLLLVLLQLQLHTLLPRLIPGAHAVFADEANVVDYHHELLGLPQPSCTFFHRPRREDKAVLLYTLSDLGVLGAVNPGSGKIVWRQMLAPEGGGGDASTRGAGDSGRAGFLRPVEDESVVVSGYADAVDAWDAATGRSLWRSFFAGQVRDVEVMEMAGPSQAGGSEQERKDILVLHEEMETKTGVLRRLDGATGNVIWEFHDTSKDLPLQASTDVLHVFLVSLHGTRGGYNIKVTIVDPVTGKKMSDYVLSTKADVHAPEDVLMVGANSAAPIIAWVGDSKKALKVNILGKSAEHTLSLPEVDGELGKVELHAPHLVQSQPHFLVQSSSDTSNKADVYHVDIANGSIRRAYELPKLAGRGTVAVSCQDANVYFTRITGDEAILVSSASHGILGRWPLQLSKDLGQVVLGVSEVVHRGGDKYAVRSAALTASDDWVLVHNGVVAWSRPEGLSGAVAAQWADIPASESLVESLQTEAHSNPLSAYVHRVKRHVKDLQYLPAYLQTLQKAILSSFLPGDILSKDPSALVRDNFGFNKLVILATARGRVYALNAGGQGRIVWSRKVHDLAAGRPWDVKAIWVQDAKGTITIRGGAGDLAVLDIAEGHVVEVVPPTSTLSIASAAIVDSPSGQWLLPVKIDGTLDDIASDRVPNAPLVVRGSNGEVKGLRVLVDGEQVLPITAWTFQPHGERILEVVAKPAHDPVASIGRVLGDRSVLYKYLNPNTVLVTAASRDAAAASFYLLDTVSGEILYSVSHTGVDTTKPITSILTEHWFAYSFFGDDSVRNNALPLSKGSQLHVTELYESPIPNDRGPLGSLDNSSTLHPSEMPNSQPVLPHAISQSYIISEPIRHMALTTTRQGITTRQLLCVLESHGIFGLPRQLLDPRRPVGRDATSLEVEEGLFRYQPVIEVDPKLVLTHQRDVLGIRQVITTPAILESTSLVLAYGIDIFGTRVAPSMAFDILGNGFGKVSLVLTVLALWVGVVVVAPMVRRKQINQHWTS